jgi:hypothetical protein
VLRCCLAIVASSLGDCGEDWGSVRSTRSVRYLDHTLTLPARYRRKSYWPSLETHRLERSRGLWHTRFVVKRPRDPVQLAKQVFDIAIGEAEDAVSEGKRHPDRVKGRSGGKRGGNARADRLTPEQRHDIAKVAASARWKKTN